MLTPREMVLGDPALEQWQRIWDTFPLSILAEVGEGEPPSLTPTAAGWAKFYVSMSIIIYMSISWQNTACMAPLAKEIMLTFLCT